MSTKVVILGACPSKDPFYRQSADMKYKILADIRTSIFTYDMQPLPITKDCSELIPSNIVPNSNNRYLIYSDFTKNTLNTLFALQKVDLIIVDVTPERLNHVIVNYNGVEYDLLMNTGIDNLFKYFNGDLEGKPIKIVRKYSLLDVPKEIIVAKYKEFFKLVYQKFPNVKIILNEVYLASHMLTSENKIIEYSKKYNVEYTNKILQYCYSALKEALLEYRPDEIKFPPNTLGSEMQIWGIYPLHFTKEYYLYVIEAIDNLCKFKRTNSVANLLKETELKYLQIIDAIKTSERVKLLNQQMAEILEKLNHN